MLIILVLPYTFSFKCPISGISIPLTKILYFLQMENIDKVIGGKQTDLAELKTRADEAQIKKVWFNHYLLAFLASFAHADGFFLFSFSITRYPSKN